MLDNQNGSKKRTDYYRRQFSHRFSKYNDTAKMLDKEGHALGTGELD